MMTYCDLANLVCRQYGLEHPITIAVMAMIEKRIDPCIILNLMDAIDRECEITAEGVY